MRGLGNSIQWNWGLRQWLGLGILLSSMLLSFLLVSCGGEDNSGSGNKVNIQANQATTPVVAPVTTTANTKLVIVALRPLPAGTLVGAQDIDAVAKPIQEINDQDITSPADALGRIVKINYNPGQQLKKADLIEGTFSTYMRQLVADKRLEPGKKAFAYPTNDLSTVGGLIQENDLVDVVATYLVERKGFGQQPGTQAATPTNPGVELTTKTVLQNVRVLRVVRLQIRPVENVTRLTPTAPPNPDSPTSIAVAAPTATPTPTLPTFLENGAGFGINTVLILGVTDQEAEVLKFTREYRLTQTIARLNTSNPIISTGDTVFNQALDSSTAIVHFVLRAKPQDPANPVDPALTRETTTGVTFRILVRDYGLPIPELIYTTGTSQ